MIKTLCLLGTKKLTCAPRSGTPAHSRPGKVTVKSVFGLGLRFEHVHGPYYVLSADGALAHPLAALGASDHVAALQQDAVDHRVHADPTQVVVIVVQLHLLTLCLVVFFTLSV